MKSDSMVFSDYIRPRSPKLRTAVQLYRTAALNCSYYLSRHRCQNGLFTIGLLRETELRSA
jgi:hypothetical protein